MILTTRRLLAFWLTFTAILSPVLAANPGQPDSIGTCVAWKFQTGKDVVAAPAVADIFAEIDLQSEEEARLMAVASAACPWQPSLNAIERPCGWSRSGPA